MSHTHIVKRRDNHTELYDNHKVYASCYASCLSAHVPKEKAEEISALVAADVDTWIDDKASVTSEEIFKHIAKVLALHDKEAALLYETHRDIS